MGVGLLLGQEQQVAFGTAHRSHRQQSGAASSLLVFQAAAGNRAVSRLFALNSGLTGADIIGGAGTPRESREAVTKADTAFDETAETLIAAQVDASHPQRSADNAPLGHGTRTALKPPGEVALQRFVCPCGCSAGKRVRSEEAAEPAPLSGRHAAALTAPPGFQILRLVAGAEHRATEGPCPDISASQNFIMRGSVDPAVRDAQRKLNVFFSGMADSSLIPDCIFGPRTTEAVTRFQQAQFPDQQPEWDGRVGPKTWAMLTRVTAPGPTTGGPGASGTGPTLGVVPPGTVPAGGAGEGPEAGAGRAPVLSPVSCPSVPATNPGTCPGRHDTYCAANRCFATSWLNCACGVSSQICDMVDAFSLSGPLGTALKGCLLATGTPTGPVTAKAGWFFVTNSCIWNHWHDALDAIHDPLAAIPSSLTPEWAAAVTTCRSAGTASKACCDAHVAAEQSAIDRCGGYPTAAFGRKPTDVPGSPFCSDVVEQFANLLGPPFTGDFGNVRDRIAYGNSRCC